MKKYEGHEVVDKKDLNREQKRFLERIELEAKQTFQLLADKFLNLFMDSDDPDGEDLTERGRQISAQWRTYVKKRKLDDKALPAIEKYISNVNSQYVQSKAEVDAWRESLLKPSDIQ